MREKKSTLSVHHIRRVLAVLLDRDLAAAVRLRKVDKLIQWIVYQQQTAFTSRNCESASTFFSVVVLDNNQKLITVPVHTVTSEIFRKPCSSRRNPLFKRDPRLPI